jgi:hypothetical protein
MLGEKINQQVAQASRTLFEQDRVLQTLCVKKKAVALQLGDEWFYFTTDVAGAESFNTALWIQLGEICVKGLQAWLIETQSHLDQRFFADEKLLDNVLLQTELSDVAGEIMILARLLSRPEFDQAALLNFLKQGAEAAIMLGKLRGGRAAFQGDLFEFAHFMRLLAAVMESRV